MVGEIHETKDGFEWRINKFLNFSVYLNHYSPYFSYNDVKWYFRICPNRVRKNGYVDLDLVKCDGDPIGISFSLAIKTVNGEKHMERHYTENFEKIREERTYTEFIPRPELERKATELLPSGILTIVFSPEIPESASEELECIRNKYKNAQLMLEKAVKEKDDIKRELDASKTAALSLKTDKKTLSKEKLELVADLKRFREKIVTVTQEKEILFQDLTGSKDKLSHLNTDMENLLKHNNDLTREKEEFLAKYTKSLEESKMQLECLRNESENAQLKFRKAVKEKDDIERELDDCKSDALILKTDNETLLKEKLELEADLKTFREELVTATQEKELLSQDLTGSKDKLSRLNTEMENLLKHIEELTREKEESLAEYANSLEESRMQNVQLKDQLLAVYQELTKEKNEKENLKSEIFSMGKMIDEFQSTKQDNIQLNSMVETLFKENVSTAEVDINKVDKSEVAESNECKVPGSNQKNVIETKESVSFANAPEDYCIVANINRLLEDKEGVDVTFMLETSNGEKEVFAHQLVLAVRSPFFADEFYSKKQNKEDRIIRLKGVNPKAFKKMIRYCYDHKPSLKTIEDACALFKVAFEFKVVKLMNLCHAFLKDIRIEPKNVFSVLEVSEQMEDKSLEDMCYKILEEKTKEIMDSYELRDITMSMVNIILKLTKLSLNSEYELITWILERAAKVIPEDKDLKCKSTRDYLGNLVQDMDFLSLTGEEFAKLCKRHPDFFTSEEVAVFTLNIMLPGTREMPEWYNKNLKARVYTGSTK